MASRVSRNKDHNSKAIHCISVSIAVAMLVHGWLQSQGTWFIIITMRSTQVENNENRIGPTLVLTQGHINPDREFLDEGIATIVIPGDIHSLNLPRHMPSKLWHLTNSDIAIIYYLLWRLYQQSNKGSIMIIKVCFCLHQGTYPTGPVCVLATPILNAMLLWWLNPFLLKDVSLSMVKLFLSRRVSDICLFYICIIFNLRRITLTHVVLE